MLYPPIEMAAVADDMRALMSSVNEITRTGEATVRASSSISLARRSASRGPATTTVSHGAGVRRVAR